MGRNLLIFVVAVATGLLIFWMASPFLLPIPKPNAPLPDTARIDPSDPHPEKQILSDGSGDLNSSSPLPAPRSVNQRAADDLVAKRADYCHFLLQKCADLIADAHPADDDPAVLLLYAAKDAPNIVQQILSQTVQPYAYKYGFRHIRFYVPNGPASIEKYRFEAEANADENAVWHVFLH